MAAASPEPIPVDAADPAEPASLVGPAVEADEEATFTSALPDSARRSYDEALLHTRPQDEYSIARRILGKDEFGILYPGVHLASGERVAIKLSSNALSLEQQDRMREEALLMKKVRSAPDLGSPACWQARSPPQRLRAGALDRARLVPQSATRCHACACQPPRLCQLWALSQIMGKTGRHAAIAKYRAMYEIPNPNATTGWTTVQIRDLWEGGALDDNIMAMIQQGIWDDGMAARIAAQLLAGVRALHEADGTGSFVHCNLSGDNVLTSGATEDAVLALAGTGQAIWVPKDLADPLSEVHVRKPVGTAEYCAPEQLIPSSSGLYTCSPAADMWSVGVLIYRIVVQRCPFPTVRGADQTAKVGTASYRPFDDTVSAEAKDLVSKLLVVDPSKRLTAAQALEHPWIVSSGASAAAKGISLFRVSTVAAGSGAAAAGPALRETGTATTRGMLQEFGGALSPQQFELVAAKLGEVLGMDVDIESAELSEEQFEAVLSKLELSGVVSSRLFHVLDVDGNGALSVSEIVTGLAQITEPSEDRARLIFSMYDADGDGAITLKELEAVLKACATSDSSLEMIKAQRISALLAEADVDNSDSITVDEFLNAVGKNPFLAKLLLQPNLHFQRFVAVGEEGEADSKAWATVLAKKAGRPAKKP